MVHRGVESLYIYAKFKVRRDANSLVRSIDNLVILDKGVTQVNSVDDPRTYEMNKSDIYILFEWPFLGIIIPGNSRQCFRKEVMNQIECIGRRCLKPLLGELTEGSEEKWPKLAIR